jgi:hypothetical protein
MEGQQRQSAMNWRLHSNFPAVNIIGTRGGRKNEWEGICAYRSNTLREVCVNSDNDDLLPILMKLK